MNEKRMRTACFTGHRQLAEPTEKIRCHLSRAIEKLIYSGYQYFGAGGARGFDALASDIVLNQKEQYPHIHLILVLPFECQYRHERDWSKAEVDQYRRLKAQASKVVTLAPEYRPGIYYQRNRHLVDRSSVCIAYMTRENSGTGHTVHYAKAKGLRVIQIAGASQLP